jgi:hypothetical protein
MTIGGRTAGGVVEIRVQTGGSGYSGHPSVVISGGGGTGAAAVAVMAGTRVDSVIVTNQGTGYTVSPAVALNSASIVAAVTAATDSATQSFLVFDPALAATTHQRIAVAGSTQPIAFNSNTVGVVATSGFTATGPAALYSGTGAAASAYAYTGTLRPLSFFQGRYGTVYGVDGMGRGVRWSGGSGNVAPIGLNRPAAGPVMTASTTSSGKRISAIQLVDGGRGYSSAPAVTLTGGSATRAAAAQAAISNGRVVGVRVSEPGSGYQAVPAVSFAGGLGSGAEFTVDVLGRIANVGVIASGSGYTSSGSQAPVLTLSSSQGLSQFAGSVLVGADGSVSGVQILNGGTGATATPTLTITAGTGSGASVLPLMQYSVATVSVSSGGTGFYTPPIVTVRADPADSTGGGAVLESAVSTSGVISAVTVLSGGQYSEPPTALVLDTSAAAQASVAEPMRGKYICAIRYIDDTPEDQGGPLASSISHLAEVDCGPGTGTLVWAFSHPHVDARATAMELWRSSGDQAVLLFRVATILKTDPEWSATYNDTLSDPDLTDASRPGYGLMPITLPSGQINARRFAVPPGKFGVGVMFQDRAWYAADTSGQARNSLYYSEVDEPESVPAANELVVQENTDLPDSVVALVPLGSMLLVVQSAHMYRLMYVAQPVLDASIMLMARRGVLNNRCWAVMAGVAFLVDSVGMYAFDGNQEQSISVAIDNYWRDRIIDLSASAKFHVDADHLTRTVRFFYCRTADTEPTRALCYCTATQAWWEETYPTAVTAAINAPLGGQLRRLLGGSDGAWRKESGTQDNTTGVSYSYRSGNMALTNGPDRTINVLYKPTANDSTLAVAMFFNNAETARQNAIQSDRGSGFTTTAGGPATINMKKTRSPLGDATGSADAHYSGRKSERSAGGDQHLAVQVAGTQAADAVTLYSVRIAGVE